MPKDVHVAYSESYSVLVSVCKKVCNVSGREQGCRPCLVRLIGNDACRQVIDQVVRSQAAKWGTSTQDSHSLVQLPLRLWS